VENLKIRVNGEVENKEAQGLLEKLGFKKFAWGTYSDYFIFANSNYYSRDDTSNFSECDYKEITLPELRDLVVLKRNDVRDATHYTEECGAKGFLTSDGIEYFWDYALKEWSKHKQSNFMEYQMKPIEKPMKEYLRKNSNGTYSYIGTVRPEHVSNFMIEIPEGTDFVTEHTTGTIHFWRKGSYKTDGNNHDWIDMTCHNEKYDAAYWCEISPSNIIWQRHTHPEELPFIDDEPKITTAKGSELDYIAKIHDMRDRYDGESDEDYRYQLEHYISRKEPSLNDQYAEIEKVRKSHRTASEMADPTIKETLSQRQSQYGSFEDVATATQDLLKILEKTGLKSLPSMHKEALHMICSKMVRIVNGDHNFIESWHDIAGYATLMENELRVTDGATNSRLTYQKVINGKLQDI